MKVDTAGTVEIRASPTRLLLIGSGALVMTLGSFAIARVYAGTGSFRELIGWIGAVFFGLGVLVTAWRAFQMQKPTLVLSPQGFRDVRISTQFIPWSAVESLSIWQYLNTKAIIAKVPDPVWRDFSISRLARWSRSANASLGADGLAISAVELRTNIDELLDMMKAYAAAHGGKAG